MSAELSDIPPKSRLSPRDWRFLAVWLAAAALAIAVVARYFDAAFPEASIEFRVDRASSQPVAERFARAAGNDLRGKKHAVRFDSDDQARVFLERTLGLKRANEEIRRDVRIWTWHHRWFEPLVEEEISVDVATTGEIVAYSRTIPEDRPLPDPPALSPPLDSLRTLGVNDADLRLVSTSERRLPKRVQRIYTFESTSIRPAGAPYRHTVTMDGAVLTGYSQRLKVPDEWIRSYRELRSKNAAAGQVDLIFNLILVVAAVSVFVVRLRRGDLPLRFVLGLGAATVFLVGGMALNSAPEQFAYYDTRSSWPAFLAQIGVSTLLQSVGMGMLLMVICGAGEVLYRERLPQHLAMPRLWSHRSLQSKRVFLGLVLGYALVPLFMAYQVVFYLSAQRFGAWAPAEVPYDDMLNSALPWVSVMFAGFFPAFSEEFLSRAFAIPFLQRLVRSRLFAITLAAFIWGFGHATYPNQPFWIRGVEVGIAGVVAGLLFDRFGLLPLLVWHYTIDAVYTGTLLFTSGNAYYVVSAAVASLLFLLPLVISIAWYVRNRGFVPDDDLTNATMPVSPPPAPPQEAAVTELPAPIPPTRGRLLAGAVTIGVAALVLALPPASPGDAVDYRITGAEAKEIARKHLAGALPQSARFVRVIATPVEGFRSWDPLSGREDGGAPSGFDSTAAAYLLRSGMSMRDLAAVFRGRVEAGTWMVRFFTPRQKEEVFVEVDPRTARVIGFHRYLDERKAGASLSGDQARAIALRTLPAYGIDPRRYASREELAFPQPARRDWVLHFQESAPLAGEAWTRVTVRVCGNEVTQVARHIHIPETVYHLEEQQTMLHVVLLVLQIAGIVTLLALAISGVVIATRGHGLPWRRPLRWAAVLAITPLVSFFTDYDRILFRYQTALAWDTFRINLFTSFVRDAGLQVGLVFLALAGLVASRRWALDTVSAEGRARFGRSAAISAVTAVAILAIFSGATGMLAAAFPARATIDLDVPGEVAMQLPALTGVLRALVAAVIVSAAAALYGVTLRRRLAAVTLAAVFCASLDPSATTAQMPLSLLVALLTAITVWVVARHVLGSNPLAWPLAVFLAVTLGSAETLLRNHRPDLTANAVALIVVAATALLWSAGPRGRSADDADARR